MLFSACSKTEGYYNYEKLYDYKSEYVGDAPNTKALAENLLYGEILKLESVRLHTDAEPYGVELIYELKLGKGQQHTIDYTALMRDAVIMFSLIDNLSFMAINFNDDGNGYVTVITREMALENTGADLASLGKSEEIFLETAPEIIEGISYSSEFKNTVTYEDMQPGEER